MQPSHPVSPGTVKIWRVFEKATLTQSTVNGEVQKKEKKIVVHLLLKIFLVTDQWPALPVESHGEIDTDN